MKLSDVNYTAFTQCLGLWVWVVRQARHGSFMMYTCNYKLINLIPELGRSYQFLRFWSASHIKQCWIWKYLVHNVNMIMFGLPWELMQAVFIKWHQCHWCLQCTCRGWFSCLAVYCLFGARWVLTLPFLIPMYFKWEQLAISFPADF